jgi:hypothetical protein
MESNSNKNASKSLVITAIVLGCVLLFFVFIYFNLRSKSAEMENVLTQEKDSLAKELRIMVAVSDTLKTNNDTLRVSLTREKDRITKLLAINASNSQLIKQYRSEIKTMREIMKSYIVQIDSLNTRNKILVAENKEVHQQINQEKNVNAELTKTKEELSSKVEIASLIQAKDIVAVSLNKKRKETTRINMLDKLKICFTLRENALAKAGPKEVFMRVLRPDSLVITNSADNLFEYKGNKLIYSASRTVDYMNQDVDLCIFLDNTGDFVVGNYSVELYLENSLIGKTNFMLSKR